MVAGGTQRIAHHLVEIRLAIHGVVGEGEDLPVVAEDYVVAFTCIQ